MNLAELALALDRTRHMMERLRECMEKDGVAFTAENVIALLQRKGYRVDEAVVRGYCGETEYATKT